MKKVRILLADDHEIIHKGLTDILKAENDLDICGHAYSGAEAVSLTAELKPDVVFMDLAMPELSGIEATAEIRRLGLGCRIIALTQHDEREYVIRFLKEGGDGYLLKNSQKAEFVEAIKAVINGKPYLSPEISELMLNSLVDDNRRTGERKVHLTRREIEIIQKIAEDKSNQEIAEELKISLRTVETHRRNLMQKLQAHSVVALLKYASREGLIKL